MTPRSMRYRCGKLLRLIIFSLSHRLGRNFSAFADAPKEFVEGDQKNLGGLIGPRTSKRQFKKQLELLVDVAVAWVQRAAAKCQGRLHPSEPDRKRHHAPARRR